MLVYFSRWRAFPEVAIFDFERRGRLRRGESAIDSVGRKNEFGEEI